MAGGYVGHNKGGHILGMNNSRWRDEDTYSGPVSTCTANRILSVYGAEFAGGFTGFMECADTVGTGGISLLFGLIEVSNLISALQVVYPTQVNTAVYGPLSNLDINTWNSWVNYVGRYGGRGSELSGNGTVTTESALQNIIAKYNYGYNVAAGRFEYENLVIKSGGGSAGGYVGKMISGVITNGQAYEAKSVSAYRCAGGYAGEVVTGGAIETGGIKVLNVKLDIGNMLDVLNVLVPVIKVSSVNGYRTGLTVKSTCENEDDYKHNCGYAGGYVGAMYGGQIWGTTDTSSEGCNVSGLEHVMGTNSIGGYAGKITAGTITSVDTNSSDGLLQNVLDTILTTPASLVSVLEATISTVKGARVSAANSEWGFTVDNNKGKKPCYAGGFAGLIEASVIGDSDGNSIISINDFRSADAGFYAGGFFGLADVGSAATVSRSGTSILDLIKLGNVSVLDAFRTYIYYADVNGVNDGIQIRANKEDSTGIMGSECYTGNAGGFGGEMLNGSIKNCSLTNLSSVEGLNYAVGFVGHLGKSGTVDVDSASILKNFDVLNLNAGVLDVWAAHIDDITLTGIPKGFTVSSSGGSECIAGGFVGYADLSKLNSCTVTNFKKVSSSEIAGGFIGKADMNYLVDTEVSSVLLNGLLTIVDVLVRALYLNEAQRLDLQKSILL